MSAKEIKCVVVGDGDVGKTCLLEVNAYGKFPCDYNPTTFDTYRSNCKIGDKEYIFTLIDTSGCGGCEQIRRFYYPGTNVFLVCFSVNNPVSYENVSANWVPEIIEGNPSAPIILVGCKCDLRSSIPNCIATSDGRRLAKKIDAFAYMECSALENVGVEELFDKVTMVDVGQDRERSRCRRCVVM